MSEYDVAIVSEASSNNIVPAVADLFSTIAYVSSVIVTPDTVYLTQDAELVGLTAVIAVNPGVPP